MKIQIKKIYSFIDFYEIGYNRKDQNDNGNFF